VFKSSRLDDNLFELVNLDKIHGELMDVISSNNDYDTSKLAICGGVVGKADC
jgi:hypothetical protein